MTVDITTFCLHSATQPELYVWLPCVKVCFAVVSKIITKARASKAHTLSRAENRQHFGMSVCECNSKV